MSKYRKIEKSLKAKTTTDGAGVKLKRVFGYYEQKMFDPFLLLDEFGSNNPDDYIAGFPWHPHRGIETVTYMLSGLVEHADSIGNKGTIGSGDIQWMTAGSGIVHTEMPKLFEGRTQGFQLWVNLPKINKMMPPRYQDIPAKNIPVVSHDKNITVKVISGEYGSIKGPVKDIIADIEYLDFTIPINNEFEIDVNPDYTVFAYIYDGNGIFEKDGYSKTEAGNVILFGKGDKIYIKTGREQARFLLISGKPLNEPIAWGGPIVMNTAEELDIAFEEYRKGTFVK